jgi:tetratricopeptide (TPR) repeat protein
VLTTLCGAYCDLCQFDKAIERAEYALKFNPVDGKNYTLNALTRAYTQRFKRDADISDIDQALEYAVASIDLRTDIYSARTYIAAAMASGREEEIKSAITVLERVDPEYQAVDEQVLIETYAAANMISEDVVGNYFDAIPEIDHQTSLANSDQVNVFQICEDFYGWIPSCTTERKMSERFSIPGWFYQGDSNLECPSCSQPKLAAIRKHIVWFGNQTHYWALICKKCRSATDSMGFDKNFREALKHEFHFEFRVEDKCRICLDLINS